MVMYVYVMLLTELTVDCVVVYNIIYIHANANDKHHSKASPTNVMFITQ